MARAKTKAAGANLPVPQSDAEAEQMIAQLGAIQRDLAEAQNHHNAQVSALETAFAEVKKASQQAQTAITEGLAIWASAHRDRLTNGGRTKTVQLASGVILWRLGASSVTHRALKVDEVVALVWERINERFAIAEDKRRSRKDRETARIEAERFRQFLRTTVTLNKDAMHEDREFAETLPGVSFSNPGESFAVEPTVSQISEVA